MADRKMVAPTQYFNSIDGLRLVASINIVLFHLVGIGGLFELGGRPLWMFRILKGPAFHASLFFILAGFIYTVKYSDRASSFSSKVLVRGRVRDLYPLHALTCLSMIPFAVLPFLGTTNIDTFKILFSAGIHLSMLWSFFPLFSYALNRPSWALSAFFLCYVFFGPVLRRIVPITSRRLVVALIALCIVPSALWGFIYVAVGRADLYQFFHVFAPVRFFEFVLGMLLARLYVLNNSKPRAFQIQDIPLLNDIIIVAALALIYLSLVVRHSSGMLMHFLSYHTLLLPLYATLLYRLARGNGVFASFFAIPFIRNLGKCSFYPYLVHVPLISWLCWTLEHGFGYRKFLHGPLNIALFMIILYGGSYLYWLSARKRKKSTYRTGDGCR